MRKDKEAIFTQLKQDYQGLKKSWNNDDRYDAWMKQSLNNAYLALVATYHELVPALKAFLHEVDGDLPKFYQQMEQLGRLTKAERHQKFAMLDSE